MRLITKETVKELDDLIQDTETWSRIRFEITSLMNKVSNVQGA